MRGCPSWPARGSGCGNRRASHEQTIDWRAGELVAAGLDRATLEPILDLLRGAALQGGRCNLSRLPAADGKTGIKSFDDFVARHAGDHIHGLSRRVIAGPAAGTLRRRASSTSPRPGPARSTGSGRGACCASCAMASAAPARAAHRRQDGGQTPRPDPGAAAARRQHRHGGPRHGEFRAGAICAWSSRATAGPTRRRALPPPAPTSSSTARRPIPGSRRRWAACNGSAPLQRASAIWPSRCSRRSRPWRRCGAGWSDGQRCGIVFGPERNGLETEEVANADAVVMAPVNPNFASLNLAQAVLLLSYEWMKQAGQRHARPGHDL